MGKTHTTGAETHVKSGAGARRSYVPPTLVEYGSVAALTQGGFTRAKPDAGSTRARDTA
jgi:hypothetical protein